MNCAYPGCDWIVHRDAPLCVEHGKTIPLPRRRELMQLADTDSPAYQPTLDAMVEEIITAELC